MCVTKPSCIKKILHPHKKNVFIINTQIFKLMQPKDIKPSPPHDVLKNTDFAFCFKRK